MSTNPFENGHPSGKFIGLVGAPGIGKGYITERLLQEPGVVPLLRITNREPRPTDPAEGVLAVTTQEFLSRQNEITGKHNPFNDERMYGYLVTEAVPALDSGNTVVGDPNIELLHEFRADPRLANRNKILGLTANIDYLKYNLEARTKSQKGSISPLDARDIQRRIETGLTTNDKIVEAFNKGLIDEIIEVGFDNRTQIVDMVKTKIRYS